MRKRRSALPLVTVLVLLLALCLAGAGLVWIANNTRLHLEATFGPPSTNLTFIQRVNYSIRLAYSEKDLVQPADPGGTEMKFTVNLGEPVGSITARLEQAGLIRNAEAFRNYLIYSGLDTRLQAGEYALSPAETAIEIGAHLMDATPAEVTFHILPGWRAEEVAAALPTSGLSITSQEFLNAISNPPVGIPLRKPMPEILGMEGFLFPDTYTFKRNITLNQMLIAILQDFDQHMTPEIQQGFKNQGLSLYQGVILASIVQREAVVTEEQPIIASVFFNRLADGMKLDSDPTVQYALGYNETQKTWWTNPLSAEDLAVSSKFNTYLNAGLPPGPISNPSLSALQAAAYPAKTPYYYFRARCDGSGKHTFAQTYEEQVKNACP